MKQPRDGWDADERDALDGLEDELAELRARHATDPSMEMLRAADADALPPELQAEVADHLRNSAWSRALVEGLREARPDDALDVAAEQRLLARIQRESGAAVDTRSRSRGVVIAGLAIAATVLIAVIVTRDPEPAVTTIGAPTSRPPTPPPPSAPPRPVATLIPFTRPDVKLSPAVLTWRGNGSENALMRDLGPAFDAYRSGDYARAVATFDKLAAVYPGVLDVLFYQGLSHLLAGDDAGAIAPLTAAGRLADSTFADDVAWFLAVAEQRSGRDARDRFAELCRAGRAYSSEACNAVAQLDVAPR